MLYFTNPKRLVWRLKFDKLGDRLVMQEDGNLVLLDMNNKTSIFTTDTRFKGEYFVVQDDGNMVVYNSNRKKKWDLKTFQGR